MSSSPSAAPLAGAVIRRFGKAKTIAEKLGVCSRTIFRWADQGKFARHKINARVVLFDEAEVAAFIEAAPIDSTFRVRRVWQSQRSGRGHLVSKSRLVRR